MANPLDVSAEAATRWIENTPDATLRACGLVNAYQLAGWTGPCDARTSRRPNGSAAHWNDTRG